MTIFGLSDGHFSFVSAFSNRINIVPGTFSVEQIDSSLIWQEAGNSLYQDLDTDSKFEDFNKNNSVYIQVLQDQGLEEQETVGQGNTSVDDEGDVGVDGVSEEAVPESDPSSDSTVEPTPTQEPVQESIPEPVSTPELVPEPTPTPIPTPEPVLEPAPIPVLTPEPVLEPIPAPTPEPSPVPVSEPAPTQDESVSFLDKVLKNFLSYGKNLNFFNHQVVQAQNVEGGESNEGFLFSLLNQKLVYSNFSIFPEQKENNIEKINLRLSMAGYSEFTDDRLLIEYIVRDEWQILDTINLNQRFINSENGDFFLYTLANVINWADLNDLKVRISYQNDELVGDDSEKELQIFLDALWLEVDYNDPKAEQEMEENDFVEEEVNVDKDEYEFETMSEKQIFKIDEKPKFDFRFRKKRGAIGRIGASFMRLFTDEYEGMGIKAQIKKTNKWTGEFDYKINYLSDGDFEVEITKKSNQFKPGKHVLEVEVEKDGVVYYMSQEFVWGVLAFNTNKSIFLPEETAYLQMGVLTDTGDTICDAKLHLEIENPLGERQIMSTDDGNVLYSGKCGANNVIDVPDYYAFYDVSEPGVYEVSLTATTLNGERQITDSFEVRESIPFEIERIGPTRIYPWADYEMKFKIKAKTDFKGRFAEYMPVSFGVVEVKQDGALIDFKLEDGKMIQENEVEKEIVWQVDWQAGKEYVLTYTFDAPDVSPEFYLLGPAKVRGVFYALDEKDEEVPEFIYFEEIRQWQIASDDQVAFDTAGSDTFDVPTGVSELVVKVWGAGGGGGGQGRTGNGGGGGGGGFSQGTMSVTAEETLAIHVGDGGGGGNDDGNQGEGGGGGAYSGVLRGTTMLIQAGGGAGGGGGARSNGLDGGGGGAGSGDNGNNGLMDGACGGAAGDFGNGALTTAPGNGGSGCSNGIDGENGDNDGTYEGGDGGDGPGGSTGGAAGGVGGVIGGGTGGNGNSDREGGGGGGGAGYHGGGGGEGGSNDDGGGGGGGGSGYTTGLTTVTTATGVNGTTGGAGGAGAYDGDSDYVNPAGDGGAGNGNNGNPGRIVIIYSLPIDVTVSATGSQVSTINIPSTNNYIGGTFVLTEDLGTSSVTDITITESGTVNAQTNLENIRIYYDLDTSAPYDCISESYSIGDTQFGATSSSFSATNGSATFSGAVEISTVSSMCVYPVMDVGSGALYNETIEIEIYNPSTDVVLASGSVAPVTSVEIASTTVLYSPPVKTTANAQRKSNNFVTIANQGWTDENQVFLSAFAQEMGVTSSKFDYYFQLLTEGVAFATSTAVPASPCSSGTAFGSCPSKIWTASASTTPWYDQNWEYRKKIIINASEVETTEATFVILATTTDISLAHSSNGGHMASTSAEDLIVVDSDGVTVLDFEKEFYNNTTGELVIWIETGISSTTNKTLYLYYGNANHPGDQEDVTGTWDSSYVMANHLNDDPGPGGVGGIEDSTSNSNDAQATAGMTSADSISGKIGSAIDFDGNGDNLSVPDSGSLDGATGLNQARTYSYWLNFTTVTANTLITDKANFAGTSLWSEAQASPNKIRGGTSGTNQLVSETTFNVGEWYYIVFEHDGDYDRLYVNGVLDAGPNAQNADGDNNNDFRIMGQGTNYEINGVMDELRITNTSHSAAWIKTEFNNQDNVNNFLNIEDEESIAGANYEGYVSVITIPDRGSVSDPSLGYKWQAIACNDSNGCSLWDDFNSTLPNFKIDTDAPDAPGNLTFSTSTATTITLDFGAQAVDPNFSHYKIFYKDGFSGVDTGDIEHVDSSLASIDYDSEASTIIANLDPDTQYIFNIWAYDFAGNKTSATEVAVTTLTAPHARAKSVSFLAGSYSGNGSTGQLSDTNQTFSTFNFSLAETDVNIKNAYILFEAQFESYHSNSGDYTGYNLTFDSCVEPCTADAFSGSGRILKDDNTVLAYDETESNQVRLLFDISNEAQLETYLGDGANMEAQVGYKIEAGTATTSIANAKATLVVTYSFNDDASTNITNTVIYPLESTAGGDSGTKLSSQVDDCDKDLNCPLFNYKMEIPEFSSKLSQWFQTYSINDGNVANDISYNINIEGINIDSGTYIHEALNGGDQSSPLQMMFSGISGFSENTAQILEYYSGSDGSPTHYLMGGEVVETYTALKSASIKTRTASFPIGFINNGQSTATASGTVQVYFPENGTGSGVVDIKKVWFRIISNSYNDAGYTITTASKVGNNSQSGNYVYNFNAGDSVIKPSFNIIHVISSSDYSELESANATTPKAVTLYSTNSSANIGGVSAELMITYTYSSEASGYLSSLSLFGGQTEEDGNATSTSMLISNSVFPELKGTKTLRSAALLGSFSMSDSDGDMPNSWFTMDMNIATSVPVCTNAYSHHDDAMNSFTEFYRDVTSSIFVTDDQSYFSCFSNDNGTDASAGAKMNAVWNYTYQWDAPPTTLTQSFWRWYNNIDAIEPTVAKAIEKTSISNVYIGDALRLRMNVAVTKTAMATSTQTFILQYAEGSDCASISSTSWENVGGVSGSEPWTGYNNPNPTDATTLSASSLLLSSSTKAQTYEESNPSGSNPRGVGINGYAEWDWSIYNNSATSSSDYCFRMIKGDGSVFDDYLADAYPKLTTSASNTVPSIPSNLKQYKDDGVTVIANFEWINENDILLRAEATDPDIGESITLYFELLPNSGTFSSATTEPVGACAYGTSYADCSPSLIWFVAPSSPGDFRTAPYIGTTSITAIPESATGYKWQVMSCDDDGLCSNWVKYNASTPNFKIDTTPPSPPGSLSLFNVNATDLSVTYGASTTEDNFVEYKIFYKIGSSGVTELDTEFDISDLDYKNYNNETSALVENLTANTQYVFNIWAYDSAGNIASSTTEVSTTTDAAFNPPSGFIDNLSSEKTDGTGVVGMVILVDDPDNDDTLRAKVFYEAGDTCAFTTPTNMTIDEADARTTATYGDPDVDSSSDYQVGTTTNWILTSPGSNYVFFDWTSKTDIPTANGDFCLGLVVNDGIFNQTATHTKVMTIDNVNPTIPGALSTSTKTYNSITLAFGSASFDTRFDAYKIFYKEGTSGVTEDDNEFDKTDDLNLDFANYGTAATTTITGLNPNTTYVFNIWAYDTFGNKASSSKEFSIKTNASPTNISADNQFFSNGLTAIQNGAWIDENLIIFSASVHDQDADDLLSFYFEVTTATGTYSTLTVPPSTACASGTPYLSCSNKIWQATTTVSSLPADWYSEDWLYRKKITIDSSLVSTTTNNFPVLVETTDTDLLDYARSDGYDILFTDSDGITALDFEREYYNSSTGEIVAWVESSISSTTDTDIYMYYGNTGATTDSSNPTGTWNANYKGVWHLNESVVDESSQANAHNDSSSNDNDADQYGNNESTGQIYQAQNFDGVNDYIQIGDDNSLDLSDALTLGFWMNGTVSNPPSASTTIFDTAGADSFVVPPGVHEITVKTWGGGGAGGAGIDGGGAQTVNNGGHGGGAGYIEATVAVTPGETLNITVGGGGGAGQVGGSANGGGGGGGGGRSEIDRGGTLLAVASGGGGGGGGNDRTYAAGADGGAGGGVNGLNGSNSGTAVAGGGGTQLSGGSAGTGANNAQAGAFQSGGDGADGRNAQGADGSGASGGFGGGGDGGLGDITSRYPGGGGGGSGYYGGGGGGEQSSDYNAGAGAGGGSSYLFSSASATSTESGSGRNAGNNDDADYASSAGRGGTGGNPGAAGSAGNDGLVVIKFTPGINILEKGDAYKISLNHDASIISGVVNSQGLESSLSAGWRYITMTYDRSMGGTAELKLYVDGTIESTADFSDVINANSDPINIANLFNGIIDELRISDIAHTAGWIETSYNNQNNVESFITISSQSTVTSYYESVLAIDIPDNPDYSNGYKWQVMACDNNNDCSSWDSFNATTPNFKIDTTDPSAPGQLVENSQTSNSVTLNFGTQTDEDNFSEYKIYYSTSLPVSESDSLHASSSDSDLAFVDYNSTSNTTISGLSPDITYYFNIWAYDIMGHKASSTVTSVVTGSASSTPGVFFYTKNDSAIYYNIWDGVNWGGEQTSGNITAASDNIRHIRTVRSDDGGRIGILFKTWDGTNQEWWATVYRFAADDFVNSIQLGSSYGSATNNQLITGCITPLSGGEFVIARNNNGSDGTLIYSWNGVDGWTTEPAGPSPGAVLNGCEFIRRPDTDNYILMTYDDDSDVGSAYYYGGSTYVNSWTAWTKHSSDEEDLGNYVGQAFFDPSNNTRGAISYSNSSTNDNAIGKYFIAGNSTLNFGAAINSPTAGTDDWNSDFVHGEFASDPTGVGIAYFSGRDTSGQLNIYKLNVTNPTIVWSTVTNGDNISSGDLYSETNDSQKPFASTFYKGGKGLLVYNVATDPSSPYYSVITSSGNTVSVPAAVPGADANLWSRVKLYNDPYEYEAVAIYQNDDVDYSAVFWDGGEDQFYSAGNQSWTELVTGAGVSENDEATSFSFTGFNTAPNNPINIKQYKTDVITEIANEGWTNETTVNFAISANDIDTYEVVALYLNLIANTDDFSTGTSESLFNACASTTAFDSCNSKIWAVASSSVGDYSVTPFTATATITSLASSTIGYKWQVIACDDESDCSSWIAFNVTQPNFYVDDLAPTAPGNLLDIAITSNSVSLQFGSSVTEDNFDQYKIFYKVGISGVIETDTPWTKVDDANLGLQNYGGASNFTIITGLSSSTQYVFNIWAYDLAGNKTSAIVEVSTTTSDLPNVIQTSYLLENDDGSNVDSNSAEVVASTTLSNVYIGERINARLQIENNGGDISSSKVYKLQFENFSDSPGTWTDVGAVTEISSSGGLSGTNGNAITSDKATANLNDWTAGTWHEDTNITGSFSLTNGFFTEFVFAVETSNALVGDTYHLRLYNSTDNKALNGYNNYSTITTVATENKRFSKNILSSLPITANDLSYFLDHLGYLDVSSDDSNHDDIASVAQIPVIMFASKHSNSTDAASSTWNGQSSVAPSVNNVILQVYRFGTTNAWVSVATNSSAAINTDFDLSATLNSNVSEYYDASDWIYWRVYQKAGTQNLRTDFYEVNFSPPVPVTEQIHYRWRKDNGNQITATWLETEDTGNPTLGSALSVGSSTRLRLSVSNTGSGSATNYAYSLEYASSSDGCISDFGNWTTVPVNDTTEHFEMITSSNFGDSDPTTAQFTNSESYTFVAGDMVEDPSNITGNISLTESRYTELEYMIEATNNSQVATTYCFRVTNSGTLLNGYNIYPVLTIGGSTNEVPAFSVQPSDNGSASTTPTDYNTNISFTATAGDSEGDSYYLAICKSDSITPKSDTAPTCTGGYWCISGETASSTEASCDYTATTSSESLDWYAFVCDKKAGFGISRCSTSSQGSGNILNDSPFVVNHPPDFTSVVTTANNINPGGTTTITAYVVDNDIADIADTIDMFVCTQNSAVAGVGCAGAGNVELCSELATSSPNAMCSFSTSTPATPGDWPYYAFIFDSHNLAALDNSRANTYTINNTKPVLGTLSLNGGVDITLNLKGAPDINVSAVNVSVTDLNGCNSLVSSVATIYMSNVDNEYNCTADDNDCYKVAVGNCIKSDCDSPTDLIATYTCTAGMKYFTTPTNDSTGNPNQSYYWMSYMQVYDGENYSDTSTSTGVDIMTGSGIDIAEAEISFGSMIAGNNTGTTNATSTVVNISNSPIDTYVSGINMVGNPSGTILVDKIKWKLTNFNYPFSGTPLSSSNVKIEIIAPKATSTVNDIVDDVYWGISVPPTADSSNYFGLNTFTVILDIDDW